MDQSFHSPMPLPAVLIGGPPHSGKSVLICSLTQALREARISHYVLRACPDGEGDWACQGQQGLVRSIRVKGPFTSQFTDRVISYLQNRPLPLLVDVGGKPTAEQEQIFAHCTHAILLIGSREDDPDAFARDCDAWQAIMARNGVPVIAVFQSDLHETERLDAENSHDTVPSFSALQRGNAVHGPVFETAVDQLAMLMPFSERNLAVRHKSQLPAEVTFIDLPHLAGREGDQERHWQPEDMPTLLAHIPENTPVGVYGRSANWVYTALALAVHPQPFSQFDAKLGWVTPPTLPRREPQSGGDDWHTTLIAHDGYFALEMYTDSQYLDIDEPERIPLPPVPAGHGLILSGRIPHWLYTAVALQLAPQQTWIAVYQPQLAGAVVVVTHTNKRVVGEVIPYQPTPTESADS